MRLFSTATVAGTLVFAACGELAKPRDVEGTFDVSYVDNLRVYIGDELVAEVESGEDADIALDGGVIQVSQLCSDEGVECPSESYWRSVGVAQPWGHDNRLLNFVDLDEERGDLGQRMGGQLRSDGTFAMLSGLSVGSHGNCAAIGVGSVHGQFDAANENVDDGMIAYEWTGGCTIAGVVIGVNLRIETDYTAVRVGDLDLAAIRADPPVDEDGSEIETGAE